MPLNLPYAIGGRGAHVAVMPTPTYDEFETVTIHISSRPLSGFSFSDEFTLEEVDNLITSLQEAKRVVERDQG